METAEIKSTVQLPKRLKEAFHLLRSGRHVCKDDGQVFRDLKNDEDSYRQLFASLGFSLEHHPRGFFYFRGENSLKTQSLQASALFVLILFQDLEDKKFQAEERQWQKALLTKIFKLSDLPHFATTQRRRMMTAVNVNEGNLKDKVFKTLKRLGMVETLSSDQFIFKPPIYRFIDVCLELSERDNIELIEKTDLDQSSDGASESEEV